MTHVGNTYTATGNMYYNNTSTALALNDAGITYDFKSLTVNGDLAISNTTTTIATALRVTRTLSISSTGTTNRFGVDASGVVVGSIYVIGNTTIGGSSTNKFGPLWTDGSLTLSGTGGTSATTLHVGASGMTIGSTTGANNIGPAYVMGNLTTNAGSTSANTFGDLWVDGKVTLGGTGATTITTLRVVGAGGLSINSITGTNSLGRAYITGPLTTASTSTSPNTFDSLWVDGAVTLNGSGPTTPVVNGVGSLHVGGAFSINSPAITNQFGPTYVIGAFGTTTTSTSINRFGALWVDGNATLNGLTTTNTTALHVGGDFTISGPTSTNTFGPVYVIGDVNWGGAATVKTTDYTDATEKPGPMWIGGVFTRNGGPFNDEYGDTFVVFQVNFTPSSGHSTVMCPLFATTERITTSGDIDFGTMVVYPADPDPTHTKARPMTLYMVCDNDGYYTQTCLWNSTGQFYGLMILFEAGITLQNGNATKPAVVGSVLTIGGDNGLQMNNNAQIAYCQDVIDWVFFPTVSTSTVTQTVPGTWQELSPSSP
jgi:hypothetical protein